MSIRSCILGIRLGVNRGELQRTRNWARSPTMQSAVRSCAGALRHTSTHLERTQGEPREPQVFEAVIEKIEEVSPEVKSLCFRISKGDGHFRAGQYVPVASVADDACVRHNALVGGSISSHRDSRLSAVRHRPLPSAYLDIQACTSTCDLKCRASPDCVDS